MTGGQHSVTPGLIIPVLDGRRLPAFPCSDDKKPLTPHGFKDATTDPVRLAELHRRYRGSLIGIATGKASGIAVLDIDPNGAGWLAKHENRLPTTRRHRTRRGVHLLFRQPEGLRGSTGLIAPGVDIKAEGGYVIWWPAAGCGVTNSAIADWPDWLLELAMTNSPVHRRKDGLLPLPSRVSELPPPSSMEKEVTILSQFSQTVARFSREESFAKAAVQGAAGRVAAAPKGRRNHVLNGEGFALGRLVARGWLSGPDALSALWFGAVACWYERDHGERGTVAAIRHALVDGMAQPYPDLGPSKPEASVVVSVTELLDGRGDPP